jgi:hypothetical protein
VEDDDGGSSSENSHTSSEDQDWEGMLFYPSLHVANVLRRLIHVLRHEWPFMTPDEWRLYGMSICADQVGIVGVLFYCRKSYCNLIHA